MSGRILHMPGSWPSSDSNQSEDSPPPAGQDGMQDEPSNGGQGNENSQEDGPIGGNEDNIGNQGGEPNNSLEGSHGGGNENDTHNENHGDGSGNSLENSHSGGSNDNDPQNGTQGDGSGNAFGDSHDGGNENDTHNENQGGGSGNGLDDSHGTENDAHNGDQGGGPDQQIDDGHGGGNEDNNGNQGGGPDNGPEDNNGGGGPDHVEILPRLRGHTMEFQHELVRRFFKEWAARLVRYRRDVALFLVRVDLWIRWAPQAAAQVPNMQTREERTAEVLAKLNSQLEANLSWNAAVLESAFQHRVNNYRREVAFMRTRLIERQISTAVELDEHIANVPPPNVDQNLIIRSKWTASDQNYIDNELRPRFPDGAHFHSVLEQALIQGEFEGHQIRGQRAMRLAMARGWSKAQLLDVFPGYADKTKTYFW